MIADVPLIRCEHVKKVYHNGAKQLVCAVDDVSFSVFKGETFGIIGESGCGKTTLGYMLLDLMQPTEGKIYFNEKNIFDFNSKEKKDFHKKCQIIFQDPYASIDSKRSLLFLIREGLDIHKIGKTKAERNEIVKKIMISVGLDSSMMNRKPLTLSGGQRQRVAIAQALALNPQLIICDEMVSSLDVLIQAQVLNLLKSLQKEFSLTYLFISHNLNVVSYMADRIAVMNKGKIVEIGKTEEILKNPQHPYTKELFNSVSLL